MSNDEIHFAFPPRFIALQVIEENALWIAIQLFQEFFSDVSVDIHCVFLCMLLKLFMQLVISWVGFIKYTTDFINFHGYLYTYTKARLKYVNCKTPTKKSVQYMTLNYIMWWGSSFEAQGVETQTWSGRTFQGLIYGSNRFVGKLSVLDNVVLSQRWLQAFSNWLLWQCLLCLCCVFKNPQNEDRRNLSRNVKWQVGNWRRMSCQGCWQLQ